MAVTPPATGVIPSISDYAMIGNTLTACLVHRNGSIDWLCLPRFDSGAVFARLLGNRENGTWTLAPTGTITRLHRRYRGDSLILETEFDTADGGVTIVDVMPLPEVRNRVDLIRIVTGRWGRVDMATAISLRFDYGHDVPWVRAVDDGVNAIAGPDAVQLRASIPLTGANFETVGKFVVEPGQPVTFTLLWHPSHLPAPKTADPLRQLRKTERLWRKWAAQADIPDLGRQEVMRSLVTLKGLTFSPTGGIVAAPTTSLPEQIGGSRNWDYRYCWLRDASLTLDALAASGFHEEARAWRDWLRRSTAGKPTQLQIMYGVGGERRLTELELPWLSGFAGSRPVRIGNAAQEQFQLDVYGEVVAALNRARDLGTEPDDDSWRLQSVGLKFLEHIWRDPDAGIWEIRGPRRHFVFSKVMAWVAFDSAIGAVQRFGVMGPVEHWSHVRQMIHDDICQRGFRPQQNTFVQHYDTDALDAALLLLPIVGFLPPEDPRIIGTVEAVQRELLSHGLVLRYRTESGVDGLPPGEAAFLACSFWLVEALAMIGRKDQAHALFEDLTKLCNDVGLLAEGIDADHRQQVGNFPQAFSHAALINAALRLAGQSSRTPDHKAKSR